VAWAVDGYRVERLRLSAIDEDQVRAVQRTIAADKAEQQQEDCGDLEKAERHGATLRKSFAEFQYALALRERTALTRFPTAAALARPERVPPTYRQVCLRACFPGRLEMRERARCRELLED
jgi:hypothetical protein